jgi:erythromycin esterase
MNRTVPTRCTCLAAAVITVAPLVAGAQSPPTIDVRITNASFEIPVSARAADGTARPSGWYVGGQGYQLALDSTHSIDGGTSLRSRHIDSAAFDASARRFGVATQSAPVQLALGRSVRLTGWIRTDSVIAGYAGLWMRIDGGGRVLHLDNMGERGPRGTTPWARYVIELPVDSGATNIIFGALHPGSGTAWFDSLRLEVFGPAMPRRVASAPAYVPPPRPAEDFTRLLTDAELALPPDDSTPPAVDSVTAAWVRANARPVRSLGARDFSDLAFLRPLLAGKRLVQLGESGHGVREFNLAKVRLIQYLHEELGFDVIAFESSLFACDRTGRQSATLSAEALMRGCIFGVWHTQELMPLFEYIRERQHTARPLVLTGFDTQVSTPADNARPTFFRRVVERIDTAYAARVYAADAELLRAMATAEGATYAEQHRDRLVAWYDSLAAWLDTHEERLTKSFPDEPAAPRLARQAARSASQFVRQRAVRQGTEGTEIRDRGMADNLDFVLGELHPGKKVMVWAHNFHIQHRGYGSSVRQDTAAVLRTTGTWVAERRRSEIYTIGLYMYRGSAALNNRTLYRVSPVAPGSLEAILHRAPWKYSFVDLSRAESSPGTEWMSRRIVAKEWGTTPQTIIPRAEYDGILFIDTTWPPQYSR